MRDWWADIKRNIFLRVVLILYLLAVGWHFGIGEGGSTRLLASLESAFKGNAGEEKITEISLTENAPVENLSAPPAASLKETKPGAAKKTASPTPAKKALSASAPAARKKLESASAPTVAPAEKSAADVSAPRKCAWKTIGHPAGDILINEVAWAGAEDEPEAEWVELKNVSGHDLDLAGWSLQIKNGISIPLSAALKPGALYIVGRAPEEADWKPDLEAKLSLSNSGERLKVFNPYCGAVDELDAGHGWPGGSNSTKKTLERKVAAEGWQTSEDGGSPGRQNTVVLGALQSSGGTDESADAASPMVPAKVLIVEVQTSGGVGKSDNDFIKLWNAGTSAADISGWKLRRKSKSGTEYSIKTFADGAEIDAGGFYLWANAKYPEGLPGQGAQATSTAALSDDNSIALLSADDVIQDGVGWGIDLVNPYAEGAYPASPLPGQILSRKLSGGVYTDTDNNAADFEIR